MSEPTLRPEARRAVIAGFVGSLLEWYDFYLYGTASALVFGKLFFSSDLSASSATALSFATFAVGYFVRPIASLFFSHFGDRIGRKSVLIATTLLMGVSSTIIGLLPTYETAGLIAPVLLIVCRMAQGAGLGGEYAGGVLVAVEHAPARRRGLFGAIPQLGGAGGLLLSSLAFVLVGQLSPEDQLSWGWRVPFLLSVVMLGFGLWIRLGVTEPPSFQAMKAAGNVARYPALEVFRRQPRALAIATMTRLGEVTGSAIYVSWALSYAVTPAVGLSTSQATLAGVLAACSQFIVEPIAGSVSDRIGRKTAYLCALVYLIIIAIPFFLLMNTGVVGLVWAAVVLGKIGTGIAVCIQGTLMSELFDPKYRYTGISIAYQFTAAAGGTIPLLASVLFVRAGDKPWGIAAFMIGMSILSFVGVSFYRGRNSFHEPTAISLDGRTQTVERPS